MLNEDNLARELSCGVCLELYNDPLQLPCMHTFCKSCLGDILKSVNSKKLKCPDCRKTTDLGKGGITSLKRNFKLASIVDIYRHTLKKEEKEEAPEHGKPWTKVRCPSPEKEADYTFLNDVISGAFNDVSHPFEPHIINDLWGTFRRTVRVGNKPSAPLPGQSQPPLPPRRPHSTAESSCDQPIPDHRVKPEVPAHRLRPPCLSSPSPTPSRPSPAPTRQLRLQPSAPPLHFQELTPPKSDVFPGQSNRSSDPSASLEGSDWNFIDGTFDIATAMSVTPPLPPRLSHPLPVSPPTAMSGTSPALPPRDNLPTPNAGATQGRKKNGRRPRLLPDSRAKHPP